MNEKKFAGMVLLLSKDSVLILFGLSLDNLYKRALICFLTKINKLQLYRKCIHLFQNK